MRKSRFTNDQILAILNQKVEKGSVMKICCEHSISLSTFYAWKKRIAQEAQPALSEHK